jgi:sphingosine kinase
VREYVQSIDLDAYRGILVISGDGLIYEVLNGLMDRPDWQRAIKMPFGQIPGGSANAFACAAAHLSNEAYTGMSLEKFATYTAFNMSKAVATPVDIVTIEMCNKKITHSFLSFEWAFIADLDLETEKYRFLGNFRFIFGAIKNTLSN